MKKGFISLLCVSLCVLTGCASEVSPETAEVIAEDIKTYDYDPNTISELKYQEKHTSHLDGTIDRELNDFKQESSSYIELSNKFNYIHLKGKTSSKDKVEDKETMQEVESWIYIRRKVLYEAHRVKSTGKEQKNYIKVEKYSEAIKKFSTYFDFYVSDTCQNAQGTEFLDSSIITDYVSGLDNNQIEYAAKFYSSGFGNLRIIGAAKCEEYMYQGVTSKVTGALSCKWDKYLLKKASLAINVNINDGTNKNDCKYNVAITKKVSKFVIPTYPNLSSFAEGNSTFSF